MAVAAVLCKMQAAPINVKAAFGTQAFPVEMGGLPSI